MESKARYRTWCRKAWAWCSDVKDCPDPRPGVRDGCGYSEFKLDLEKRG